MSMRCGVGDFLKGTYLIADKEVHDWSGYQTIGIPTLVLWSVVMPILRFWVFK